MSEHILFSSLTLGSLSLPNRIVMGPMTRCRTSQPGNIPNSMMADYYAQRASAGLIITEATQVSERAQGYSFTPGIHTQAQIEGWKLVTQAVHAKGGRIFCQLWHVGRLSHSMFHPDGQTLAPSALSPNKKIWASVDGVGQLLDCPIPKALSIEEIQQIVQDFAQAAQNAIEAGFDGVEIHGANGYLIDQFLRTPSNIRTDIYGGSTENRLRFLKEILLATSERIGANKVGLRLSPVSVTENMYCPFAQDAIIEVAHYLQTLGIAYLHLSESDWDPSKDDMIPESFRVNLRAAYQGPIIVAGGYTKARGAELIDKKLIDLVTFGRPFISNPDLVYRLENDLELTPSDASTYFGGNGVGYLDYTQHH